MTIVGTMHDVIDDISYIPHDRDATDVLFLLLSEQHRQFVLLP